MAKTIEDIRKKKIETYCKSMFAQIRSMWGEGWRLLGDDLKRAVIAERVLHVFAGRVDDAKITPAMIAEYFQAMKHYCGLDTDVDS